MHPLLDCMLQIVLNNSTPQDTGLAVLHGRNKQSCSYFLNTIVEIAFFPNHRIEASEYQISCDATHLEGALSPQGGSHEPSTSLGDSQTLTKQGLHELDSCVSNFTAWTCEACVVPVTLALHRIANQQS